MKAICIDDNHTWRNVLTVCKEYDVLKMYTDNYDIQTVVIVCDDEKIRPYRADRFTII